MYGDVVATAPGALAACAPPPPSRLVNVHGTANAAAGYRLRAPGSSAFNKRPAGPLPTLLMRGAGQQEDEENECAEEMRLIMLKQVIDKIQEKKKIGMGIRKMVEQGMEAYEEDLEARRDRLRELLLREEAKLTRELVASARRQEEARAAALVRRAAEAAQEQEEARQRLLRDKKLQQVAETSQELREARCRAWTEDAKRANLVQIAEAEERRRMADEDEAFWYSLMREHCLAGEAREASEASKRAELERRAAQELIQQMEAKSKRDLAESPIRVDANVAALPLGKTAEEEAALLRAQRRRLRDDLEEQLREAQKQLEKRRCEESVLDRLCTSLDLKDRGGDRRQEREARRKEILAYMKSLKDFRDALAKREAESDECALRWAGEAEAKRREAKRRAKDERARQNGELRLAWERQHEDKLDRERRELENDASDAIEAAECAAAEEKAERLARRQRARDYGRDLLAQQEDIQAWRMREQRRLDERVERQRIEREDEERKFARELMVRSLGSVSKVQ